MKNLLEMIQYVAKEFVDFSKNCVSILEPFFATLLKTHE